MLQEHYEVTDVKLGRGANGDVLLAHNKRDGKPAAVKRLDFCKLNDLDDWSLLERELEILAVANHPKVIGAIGIYESSDRVEIVTPYMQTGSLHAMHMTERQAVYAVEQMLNALAYLHTRGIVHRDIKPANFVCDEADGSVKIIDFGLAAFWRRGEKKMELRCGTPGYTSPEMRTGRGYTSKTDIWSLGITLYELLMGSIPFHAEAYPPQQADVDVVLASANCSNLSSSAKHLLAALLTRDASSRPCADEALLHPWLAQAGTPESEAITEELRLWESSLRRQSEESAVDQGKTRWADLEDSDSEECSLVGQSANSFKDEGRARWADLEDGDCDLCNVWHCGESNEDPSKNCWADLEDSDCDLSSFWLDKEPTMDFSKHCWADLHDSDCDLSAYWR